MRVFMTGATGVVGKRAVPLLVKAGHAVAGAARTPEKAQTLACLGARPVMVDLFDPAAVLKAVEGHDAIINLATSIPSGTRAMLPFAWRKNDRIRREVSRNLVDAALKVGATRYVQESFALIYADSGASWINEQTPVRPARYVRSVVEAERQAAGFTEGGGAGVVLRFALFYGPDSGHTLDMIRFTRKGMATAFGSPDGYISSVSTDDAAAAVVAALSVPAGVYNVVDDEPVTKREYFAILAAALGVSPPHFPPRFLQNLAGSMGEALARSHRIRNRLLKERGGWSPRYRSVREGLPALVAHLPKSSE